MLRAPLILPFIVDRPFWTTTSTKHPDMGHKLPDGSCRQHRPEGGHEIALVQNIFERITSATEPLCLISADGTTTSTNNILLWNNAFAGARQNLGYNDTGTGGPYPQTNWSVVGNIFSNYNNKDDVFGSNPDATGSWPVGYHVGARGNHYRTSASEVWFVGTVLRLLTS